jgi:hypothetical protein
MLSREEFCLAMYLIDHVVEKEEELPIALPDFLHPEKFRNLLP